MKRFVPLMWVALVSACGPADGQKQVESYTLERQVATIDHGYVTDDDIAVKRVRYLLNELQRKTGESPTRMAEMANLARKMIEDNYGKKTTVQQVLEDINNSEVIASKAVKPEEYFAVYVGLAGR